MRSRLSKALCRYRADESTSDDARVVFDRDATCFVLRKDCKVVGAD
jgi:hypothetical protein